MNRNVYTRVMDGTFINTCLLCYMSVTAYILCIAWGGAPKTTMMSLERAQLFYVK